MADDEEVPIGKVTIRLFFRDNEQSDYVKASECVSNLVLCERDMSIGWVFPDGSSALDLVVVDGNEFSDMNVPIISTGVKEGSLIQVYRTMLNVDDHEEEDDEE